MAKFTRENRSTLLLVLLAIAFCAYMLPERYTAHLLCNIAIYGIAVTGLDILYGYSGQISFGHAGFYAIGAYTSAILTTKHGVPPIVGILLAIVVSALGGLVVAFPASKLVKHFLSLLTIAFGSIVLVFIINARWLTEGNGGIKRIPRVSLFGLTLQSRQHYFFFVLFFLVATLILKRNIIHSRMGRAFVAIKENAHAAAGMGINVRKYRILAFVISAALTGLAGALYAHLNAFISPDSFVATQSTLFMTMLLFGGICTFIGPIIGASVLTYVQIAFQSLSTYQGLIYAVFVLVTLFWMPSGVCGLARRLRDNMGRRAAKRAEGK